MSNTTTDLEILRKEPHRFTWGKIDEIIDVGEYTIVKYTAHGALKETLFSIYVNGNSKASSRHCRTLDGALLYAIALRANAPHLAEALGRIVNLQDDL